MAGSLRWTAQPGRWLAAVFLTAGAGCDQSESPGAAAASDPASFGHVEREVGGLAGADQTPPEVRTRSTPGANHDQGRLRGASAAHVALNMVLESAVSPDGKLLIDRLSSSMNMDFLDVSISTFAKARLPDDPAAQLVFYCNAYNANALAILMLFAIDPDSGFGDGRNRVERITSGKAGTDTGDTRLAEADVQERFDEQPVMVSRQSMTMRELREKRIVSLGDPRVLAYLINVNGTSIHLPRESLRPRRLDVQLDALCSTWVNTGSLAQFRDGELQFAPTLSRYASAFEVPAFGGIIGFLERYAEPDGPVAAALRQASGAPTTLAE